ncbi:MAG: aspartate carbamoyltransferase [Candidatus Aenigmarchaeota archaeon]|nr:aspartate carbamoyltransferase [Candidatus Aenigmarchaeota archaeon]
MWNGKKDLLGMNDLSKEEIEGVIRYSSALEPLSGKGSKLGICRGEILISAFFEPSTRTVTSFAAAMHTLGGDVQTFLESGSSIEKGETKEDTIRTLEQYGDALVIRDSDPGSVARYASLVKVPVINAGDGINEHPTQALYDMYTIWKQFGRLTNLRIAVVGGLKYYRPSNSLVMGLGKFEGNKIFGICPPGLSLSKQYSNGCYEEMQINMTHLNEVLEKIKPDVVYVTRLKKEYMPPNEDTKNYFYVVDNKTMAVLPQNCIVMHALPRVWEINTEIDSDPRAIMFKQARHSLQVRMAVLALFLGHEDELKKL